MRDLARDQNHAGRDGRVLSWWARHNQRDTLRLPDAIADADGVLIEPAACVVKSLRRSGLKARRKSILIIGLGIMGMMHVVLARHLGAGTHHRRGPV